MLQAFVYHQYADHSAWMLTASVGQYETVALQSQLADEIPYCCMDKLCQFYLRPTVAVKLVWIRKQCLLVTYIIHGNLHCADSLA